MALLQMSNITKSYDGIEILENVSFQVNQNEKIAIVGKNGAGKSTLLKIMAEDLSYDSGEVFKQRDLLIGYFSQDRFIESNQTIYNELLKVFEDVLSAIKECEKITGEISVNHNSKEYNTLINKYDNLQEYINLKDGYNVESKIKNILSRFGFKDRYNEQVSNLSGGEKTRLALAKLLLESPDVLLLDEPTNHLDLDTIQWLESYLKNYRGAVIIISHDRFFLDQVVNIVYEISKKRITKYIGNYSHFTINKDKQYQLDTKQFEKQQKEIKKLEDFVQKNITRASTTKRAQSRRKQLEKIDRLEKPQLDNKSLKLNFLVNKRSGNDVLSVDKLLIGYDGNILMRNITFNVNRLERVAVLGPNGIGKSTLLKTIMNVIPKISGEIKYGKNLDISYFNQEQLETFKSNTVINEIWDEHRTMLERDVRTYLGQFLFSGDDVFKNIEDLSGGEKVRLALCKTMLKQANFLILDEPTNHLDISSKEVLEEAISNYNGTVIFVSHDRYFIEKIATKIVHLSNDRAVEYIGNYSYFLEKIQTNTTKKETNNLVSNNYKQNKVNQRQEEKRLREVKKLEDTIQRLEEELDNLQEQLYKPDIYNDYQKSHDIQERIKSTENDLDTCINNWEALHQ